MFNVVDHLLGLGFKTQVRLAECAEVGQVAVAGWKVRNSIPHERQRIILRNAERFGVQLDGRDFFEQEAAGAISAPQASA